MSLLCLPSCFREDSIACIYTSSSYDRFLAGEALSRGDLDLDASEEECDEIPFPKDGTCLVTSEESLVWDGQYPEQEFVERLVKGMYLAESREGRIRKLPSPALYELLSKSSSAGCASAQEVALAGIPSLLDEKHGERRTAMLRHLEAYLALAQTGQFCGVLSRARCHIQCGCDFVWVTDNLCRFWMYSDGATPAHIIACFPFRIADDSRSIDSVLEHVVWMSAGDGGGGYYG